MNLPPIPPVIIGAAGSPLAQTKGAELDRAQQETAQQQRQVQTDAKAELAAGIGTTEEQQGADSERDADGRRLWERPAGKDQQKQATPAPPIDAPEPRRVRAIRHAARLERVKLISRRVRPRYNQGHVHRSRSPSSSPSRLPCAAARSPFPTSSSCWRCS